MLALEESCRAHCSCVRRVESAPNLIDHSDLAIIIVKARAKSRSCVVPKRSIKLRVYWQVLGTNELLILAGNISLCISDYLRSGRIQGHIIGLQVLMPWIMGIMNAG